MRVLDILRSLVLWTLTVAWFTIAVSVLLFLSLFLDPLGMDWPVRVMCRTVCWLAGMRVEVRRDPGFDPHRPCLFVGNHVNLFDPFVLISAIPQFARGVELASHFKIPVYGALMKRFGNIPVHRGIQNLPLLQKEVQRYLERGLSVVVFPEGKRTLDGQVGTFKTGMFVIARQIGATIVPFTQEGAFECNRKGGFLLRPGRIVVHLHAPLDPTAEPAELAATAQRIVAQPLSV